MARLIRRRAAAPDDDADAATTALTLAVMLGAGVTASGAWTHLAESGNAAAARVRDAHQRGMPLPTAIAGLGDRWSDVAATWAVASAVGAPLADTLRGIASAMRDAQEANDEVRVALAEPAATAKLMAWLPLVAVALGLVLGFDTVGVLLTNPLGIGCLIGGLGLIVAAHRWNARLVGRAREEGAVPGIGAELLAVALSGGVSIDRARAVVDAARPHAPGTHGVDAVLALSRSAGVPAVDLLRATAQLERHRARVDARVRAARLSSRLLLPLGVCTLPAFLLLGVVPMFLSVLSTAHLTLP